MIKATLCAFIHLFIYVTSYTVLPYKMISERKECAGLLGATSILIINFDRLLPNWNNWKSIYWYWWFRAFICTCFLFIVVRTCAYISTLQRILSNVILSHIPNKSKLNFVFSLYLSLFISFLLPKKKLGYCIIHTYSKHAGYLCGCVWKSIATFEAGGFRSNHRTTVQ